MTQIRWGVIGPGRIAHTFARDIALVKNARLQSVASRSAESARAFAQTYSIPSAYGAYDDLYADESVDAVYIATPHNVHARQILDAIAAGKSVMCEKPLTVTPAECEAVMAAARKAGVFVMEAMWTYFLPAMRRAKAWYDEGRIGRLVQLHSTFGYPMAFDADERVYDPARAGGCLLDMGVYPVAINRLFQPLEPGSLEAVSRFAPNGVEDDVSVLLNYENATSTLATSFRARLPNSTYVVGETGYIAIPDSFRASRCSLHQLDREVDAFDDQRTGSGFEFQIEAASADILAGRVSSSVMPLAASLSFQRDMAAVKATFVR